MADKLRGHKGTIGERFTADAAALQPLPAVPYDACDKQMVRVSSLSLVRYRSNDYSVPTQYGHQPVMVRGYVHEVVTARGTEMIARHPRSWEKKDYVFDPFPWVPRRARAVHYLALIEQKISALDRAAPLADWELPEAFITLRRLMEARMASPASGSLSKCYVCWRPSP
ncbi:IS21 family transposase [Ahrensia sp. R2A130]|nr:IS21 family transposase [Ahrensia sp. R2A130]